MATLSTTHPTLLDRATRTSPDGSVDTAIAELLHETNEALDDIPFMEANLPTGHRATVRTGLPTPTWRKLNQRVAQTKSRTAQIEFTVGNLWAYSEVDKDLADLNGNTAEFMLSESEPHIEGMAQEMAETLFLGNESTEPEAFTGFANYYNDLSAESADNIIDAGGTGSDNASIYLIVWGSRIHGITPKGSATGLQQENKGQVTSETSDGLIEVYRQYYNWKMGLVVKDWRYCVRICNIDKSLLTRVYTSGTFSSGANLPDLMFQAMRLPPNLMGRPAFYMSRDIATWVSRQTLAIGQNGLVTSEKVSGDMKFTERFHGIPMRRMDVLAADEARVT